MVLRVSVVLLYIFLSGGYSLRCYSCSAASAGSCNTTVEICKDGYSECESSIFEQTVGSSKVFFTTKWCANQCEPGTKQIAIGGTVSTRCCDTDLCNAADGVFKGSFLLLFSPLLFYFLFQ